MAIDTKALLDRNENLKRRRNYWFPLYQALAQFVLQRKQYFTTSHVEGPFVINGVFDSTAIHSAHMTAASVLGQIWPNPFESFEFVPQVAQDEEMFSDAYDMMNTVNDVMPVNLSQPEAGVMTAFTESVLDAVIFGTGAVAVIETGDFKTPIKARAVDTKTMCIDENEFGQVDTVYWEKEYTVGQLANRFGLESCSPKVQELHNKGKLDEKVKVLQVIEPRRDRNPLKLGNQDKPFASVHLEIDTKHVLLESGYNEMPIIVFRFWKNVGEVQGRSPAMDALSDIRALNKLVEIYEKAGEMGLDPPKMISREDVLGAGKIPWGPGAWIPTANSGRLDTGRKPIEPILTITNPSWATQRISDLRDNIMQYFMLDKLSDLNNRSRQTLGEANIRNELRQFMTGPMLTRMLIELVGPFLDRAFNILLEMGFFGVVEGSQQDMLMQAQGLEPKYLSEDFIDKRMAGLKGYRINFLSPAARLMKLEEAQGLDELYAYMMQLAQLNPEVIDNFDFDAAIRLRQRLSGASQKILKSPARVEQERQQRQAAQAEMQNAQMEQAGAQTFKDVAKGVKDIGGLSAA